MQKGILVGIIIVLVGVLGFFVGANYANAPDTPDSGIGNGGVACTLEAKICPDGSAVGRIGPNCEFAPCP